MSQEPHSARPAAGTAEELAALVAALFSPLAHDLRASLNGISVWTHLLARDGDEITVRAVDGIRHAVTHQSALAHELSQLGAALAAQQATPEARSDLAAVCRSVIGELHGAHPERDIALAAPASLEVAAHHDVLHQLVRLLLADLIAATPAGGPLRIDLLGSAGHAVLQAASLPDEAGSAGARRRTLRQALAALAAGMLHGQLQVELADGASRCALRLPAA
jgi:signal transduction histidine kinase